MGVSPRTQDMEARQAREEDVRRRATYATVNPMKKANRLSVV